MYQPRLTEPEKGNPFYTTCRDGHGGIPDVVEGNNPQWPGDVSKNCVGFAIARFIEAEYEATGQITNYNLSIDAQYLPEQAKKIGLPVYDHPVIAGIMVWRKSDNSVGHCGTYELANTNDSGVMIESELNGHRFRKLVINSDNDWAHPDDWYWNRGYRFAGCIGHPKNVQDIIEGKVKPNPNKDLKEALISLNKAIDDIIKTL